MNWILIMVLIVIAFVLFKFKEIRHRFGLTLGIIAIIFLVVTVGSLYATNNLDLTSVEGLVRAGKLYFDWLGSAFRNIVKVSGYAIKQDWNFNYTNSS